MPVLLPVGSRAELAQNTVYSLPGRQTYIFSNAALEISNDSAFGAFQTVALNTPTLATGMFVRCTGSAAIVRCLPF